MKEKIYKDLDAAGLVQQIEGTFRSQGYDVQDFQKDGDSYVQIKKGGLRTAVGMSQALTVQIHKDTLGTKVALGQARWVDKAAVEAVGFLLFLPLMIPGAVGIYEQHKLPGKIWQTIDAYASSLGQISTNERTVEAVHCPHCGVLNAPDTQFCSACGSALKPEATVAAH
jgi:zinc-ribbon domain